MSRKRVAVLISGRGSNMVSLIEAAKAQDYPADRLEIIVADGMSDDRTREILAEYERKHPRVRMIDNPGRTAPCGLNVAIAAAKGFEAMDSSALERLVDDAIAANPGAWANFVAGEDKAIGALVGAVMKASRGQADGGAATALIRGRAAQSGG